MPTGEPPPTLAGASWAGQLQVGTLIQTNYSGPYRIQSLTRDCRCQGQRPHVHLVCTNPDGSGRYYLNGWDEQTLRSLDKTYCGFKDEPDYDTLTILAEGVALPPPIQGPPFADGTIRCRF